MTEDEQPPQNGIDLSAAEDDDINKARPADIEQDMREMERRKRVEAIMGSKLFREELERIVDSARDSGFTGILQQLSDIVGVPNTRIGNIYKTSNCMVPINDIRGVESMGYGKGEKILRCKLAATFRLLDLYGYTQGLGAQITARLKVDQEVFLVNPYGLLYHEITASSLNKVDMQGQVVEQGTTNFGVNKNHFMLHSVVHAARPDIRCAIYIGCSPVVAVSSLKTGLLPLTKDACVLGEISTHAYSGSLDAEERDKLVRNLGPNSKVMLLSNHGALCCGETIEEAFNAAYHIVQACETQLKLLPVGVDNLVLIPEESRRVIYEQSRRPPEDLEKKFSAAVNTDDGPTDESAKDNGPTTSFVKIGGAPKWRVGGAEFEALMRMLDNAGFRTGYIYRYPLIKSEPPRPKNDVELPPAVSSLGYLLEEEEMFRQGIWKRGEIRKGGDRSRWLNSPNVYQKVEVLETGTPDPKKITKWVAEGSPTHSTPVRIEDPLQFVPVNTNPREFKRLQQQIKDNRRADKISAGPQSLILEGVTWDEANRIKDATVSSAGDHVVLMGAASKGIIQRGFQHNATVYKAPYAKNPFDNVTDDELNEYKRTVERKKKSIHGEYTDTDFSESEALSSLQTSGAQHTKQTTTTTTAAVSQSEPEDVSEHQVMRIETKQAPVPSQPEVVLSDATLSFINGERVHTTANRKPPTGRDKIALMNTQVIDNQETVKSRVIENEFNEQEQSNKENIHPDGNQKKKNKAALIAEMQEDFLFQRQKDKHIISAAPKTTAQVGQTVMSTLSNRNYIIENGGGINNNDNDNGIYVLTTIDASNDTGNETNDSTLLGMPLYEDGIPSEIYVCNNDVNGNHHHHHHHCCQHYYYSEYPVHYEPQYDVSTVAQGYASNESTYGSTCTDRQENNDIYKKSVFCYTPSICEHIFETVQRHGASDNDNLIYNVPFSSISSSHTHSSRNSRAETADTQQSAPYRTVSHFGFNSPQREPRPKHKHIPSATAEPTKYVPLSKCESYDEIFASPRYIDLCESCFEKVVRKKPEMCQFKARLRNLPVNSPEPINREISISDIPASDLNAYDYVEPLYLENNEVQPLYSSQLEPVIEVEEIEQDPAEDDTNEISEIHITPSNSSFIRKIKNMNYSEESTNFIHTPHTVSSNISVDLHATNIDEVYETIDLPNMVDNEEENLEEDRCSKIEQQKSGAVFNGKTTITDIWEFSDWQNKPTPQEIALKANKNIENRSVENVVGIEDDDNLAQESGLADLEQEKLPCDASSQESASSALPQELVPNDLSQELQSDNTFEELVSDNLSQKSTSTNSQEKLKPKEQPQEFGSRGVPQVLISDYVPQALASNDLSQELLSDNVPEELASDDLPQESKPVEQPKALISENLPQELAIDNLPQALIFDDVPQKLRSDDLRQELSSNESPRSYESDKTPRSSFPINLTERINLEISEWLPSNLLKKHPMVPQSAPCIISHSREKSAKHSLERSLMSRSERGRRKLEFQELWEDHVHFFSGKERNSSNESKLTLGAEENKKSTKQHSDKKSVNDNLEDLVDVEVFEGIPVKVKQHCFRSKTKRITTDGCEENENENLKKNKNRQMPSKLANYPKIVEKSSPVEVSDSDSSKTFETCLLQEDEENDVENELKFSDLVDTESSDTNLNWNFNKIVENNDGVINEMAYEEANSSKSNDCSYKTAVAESDNSTEKEERNFSSLELKILDEIETNHLKEDEEIFDRIETTIRNKKTPLKLEEMIKKQIELEKIQTSTPTYNDELKNISKIFENSDVHNNYKESDVLYLDSKMSSTMCTLKSENSLPIIDIKVRRTRSLPTSSDPTKKSASVAERFQNYIKTGSPVLCESTHSLEKFEPNLTQSSPNFRRTRKEPAKSPRHRQTKKRNFILENIRNAAKPRLKRLNDSQFNSPISGTTSPTTFSYDRKNANGVVTATSKQSASPVFSFQSKMVGSSPKIWVSLPQTPTKRLKSVNNKSVQKRRRSQSKNRMSPQKVQSKTSVESNEINYLANLELTNSQSWTSTCTFDVEKTFATMGQLITCSEAQRSESVCTIDVEAALAVGNRIMDMSVSRSISSTTFITTNDVELEIEAFGNELENINPHLENFEQKLDEYGATVSNCAREMDECIEMQNELEDERKKAQEKIIIQQYAEKIQCDVDTYSLSETED